MKQDVQVAQIWIDPKYPDAHHDLPCGAGWCDAEGHRRAGQVPAQGRPWLFLRRRSTSTASGEIVGGTVEKEHTLDDLERAMGSEVKMVIQ